jgi:TolB-like protein
VALLFAWIHQLAPADGAAARATTGMFDWALMGALVVVIALVSYQQLAPTQATRPAEQQQASVTAARTASASVGNAISIAVLPFANMSGDATQEFFSDGITEEITSALAKVPDLRVVARTSAFEFKGKNGNIKAMGEQLGATHLIEGSVRKAGDRVRITAQLIKADDGTHLWAEDYDRQLTDIFQIQEDIARAIANALRIPLGLKPGQNLISSRNIEPAIYQEFLRIRAKQQAIPGKRLEAIEDLEKLLSRAPNFAKTQPVNEGARLLQSQVKVVDEEKQEEPVPGPGVVRVCSCSPS